MIDLFVNRFDATMLVDTVCSRRIFSAQNGNGAAHEAYLVSSLPVKQLAK
jgi:hypothetical protein